MNSQPMVEGLQIGGTGIFIWAGRGNIAVPDFLHQVFLMPWNVRE